MVSASASLSANVSPKLNTLPTVVVIVPRCGGRSKENLRSCIIYVRRLGDNGGLRESALRLSSKDGEFGGRLLRGRRFSVTSISFGYSERCARHTLRDSGHCLSRVVGLDVALTGGLGVE